MAILKYKSTFIGITSWVYEDCVKPDRVGKLLKPSEARRRIEKQGLVLAYEDENGCVWDTPKRAFWEKYRRADIKEV